LDELLETQDVDRDLLVVLREKARAHLAL
jgi:hypothetical protein